MHPCPLKVTLTLSSSCYAAAKSLQSCPTLCDPRDGSPPGSSVPGILQARTLEWVAIVVPISEMQNQGLEMQIVQDHLQSEYLNSGVLKASSSNYKMPICPI